MITTIITTTADDQRLTAAFGTKLGLGRNATAAEIKADLIAYLVRVVQDQEVALAIQAAKIPVDLIPT